MMFYILNLFVEVVGKFYGNYLMFCKMWCYKNILLIYKRWNEVGNGFVFKGILNIVDEMSWNKISYWLKYI